MAPDGLPDTHRNTLYNNPAFAIEAYNALTITCNPNVQESLLDTLEDFEDLFKKADVHLLDVFGDYKLRKFSKKSSERLIMIFK